MAARIPGPIQWYGGKGLMQAKIQPYIEQARAAGATVYCEPYCGAAATLFGMRVPFPVEVINDLDGRIINLFRVLQDRCQFAALKHRLHWTPYSLGEFTRALSMLDDPDPLRRAWGFFVAQNQGFGGTAETPGNWGRAFVSNRGMAETASRWQYRVGLLDAWRARLMRVQIDSRDALEVVRYWDSPATLFYIDPPYVADTRAAGSRNEYYHEATDAHHAALVELLLAVQGQVILSGYEHEIYAPLDAAGWQRQEFATAAHSAGKVRGSKMRGAGAALKHVGRTEVIWSKTNHIATLFDLL